jgi:hypothetical protein
MKSMDGNSPIFICGYPKSGTTLLHLLLDNHPELLVFPEETRYLQQVMKNPNCLNPKYVLEKTGVRTLGVGKRKVTSGMRDCSSIDFDVYQHCVNSHWADSQQSAKALLEIVMHCYGLVTEQINRKYWVEKTPLNEMFLRDAANLWPQMRAVYIVRDPRDNFTSYRKQRKKQVDAHGDENELYRLLTIVEFVGGWMESLRHWDSFSKRFPLKTLVLRYCDLVQEPEKTTRQLCDFLQIDWTTSLLSPTRLGILWEGNSMHDTEFSGISDSSLGRYRTSLASSELYLLENWVQDWMRSYQWDFDTKRMQLVPMLVDLLRNCDDKLFLKLKLIQNFLWTKMAKAS